MKKLYVLGLLLCLAVQAKLVDSWPLVVRSNTEVSFTLVIENEPLLEHPETLALQYVSTDSVRPNGKNYGRGYDKIPFTVEGNMVKSGPVRICGETHHSLRLVAPDAKGKYSKDSKVLAFHNIYSVEPDLFRLKPYRGTFHASSQILGDNPHKTPTHQLVSYRQRGYDFVFYAAPKLADAKKAVADFPFKTDMKLLPAEEIFIPNESARLLALNPDSSVMDWFMANGKAAVAAEMAKASVALPVATTNVLVDAGRKVNGFMVLEHVNDRAEGFPYLPKPLTDAILDARHYDAWEAIGSSNANLDIAQYYDLCNRGPRVPVVGGSGLISNNQLGINVTVVLAESDSLADLYAAVRACKAVPFYQPPNTYRRICADFRHGRYTTFLIRYVFPRFHDPRCREEAAAMYTVLDGPKEGEDPQAAKDKAAETLKNSHNITEQLMDKYWQK